MRKARTPPLASWFVCAQCSSTQTQTPSSKLAMVSLFPAPSPALPPFSSICVTGPYALPMPLYLCIQTCLEELSTRPVVFVTPSRESLLKEFAAYNDYWLSRQSGKGKYTQALSQITIVYVFYVRACRRNPLNTKPSQILPYNGTLAGLHVLSSRLKCCVRRI